MADLIRIKRGIEANLPPLATGEFGYCTDTNKLFIGGEEKNEEIQAKNPPWTKGMTINIYGDSLNVPVNSYGSQNWVNFISDLELGAVNNYAKNSGAFCDTSALGMLTQVSNNHPACDMTITFAGGNDWVRGNAFGTPYSALNTTTFYGAVNQYFNYLNTTFAPGTKHIVVNLLNRNFIPQNQALDIQAYRFALKHLADFYGFTVIDPFYCYGLNPKNAVEKNKFFDDDTHPNTEGSKLLAFYLVNSILTDRVNTAPICFNYVGSAAGKGANKFITPANSSVVVTNERATLSRNIVSCYFNVQFNTATAGSFIVGMCNSNMMPISQPFPIKAYASGDNQEISGLILSGGNIVLRVPESLINKNLNINVQWTCTSQLITMSLTTG